MDILPVNNDGARAIDVIFSQAANVENLTFRTYYNYTAQLWYMDILTEEGAAVAYGLALVPNINILRAHPDLTRRIGDIRVAAFTPSDNKAPDDLGVNSAVVQFVTGEYDRLNPPGLAIPEGLVDLAQVLR